MTETMTHWTDDLKGLRACREAVEFARGFDSLDAAWQACERGDWMLWLVGKLSGDRESDKRKQVVLCACACARTALPHVKAGETRPLTAIETAERWARDEGASIADVRAYAAYAAYAAAYAAYAADAAVAVAAYAAVAAAAYAAAYAADAADAADAAAYAAAYAAVAVRAKTLKMCADIVRQHYPTAPPLGGVR